MNIRPKTFVAVVNFSCGGQQFAAGDVVPPSAALEVALRYGDRFVVAEGSKRAKSVADIPPASDPTPTPDDGDPVDTPKE